MVLIVGCGYLGSYLLRCIAQNSSEGIIATYNSQKVLPDIFGVEWLKCDVTDSNDLLTLRNRCANEKLTVFYFAACHNIDFVFENAEYAYNINVDALYKFIHTIPNISKLFFSSTDCVYGEGYNKQRLFAETDKLNPINVYGRQKAQAERIILDNNFTVLRLPFMFGPSLNSKPHFYDKICTSLSNLEPIEMIDGMYRSMLSYASAAKLIYSISQLDRENIPDIINIAGDYPLSKYELGCLIAKKLGVTNSLVRRITEEDGKQFFMERRAACTVMSNHLLKKVLGISNISWEEYQ